MIQGGSKTDRLTVPHNQSRTHQQRLGKYLECLQEQAEMALLLWDAPGRIWIRKGGHSIPRVQSLCSYTWPLSHFPCETGFTVAATVSPAYPSPRRVVTVERCCTEETSTIL